MPRLGRPVSGDALSADGEVFLHGSACYVAVYEPGDGCHGGIRIGHTGQHPQIHFDLGRHLVVSLRKLRLK